MSLLIHLCCRNKGLEEDKFGGWKFFNPPAFFLMSVWVEVVIYIIWLILKLFESWNLHEYLNCSEVGDWRVFCSELICFSSNGLFNGEKEIHICAWLPNPDHSLRCLNWGDRFVVSNRISSEVLYPKLYRSLPWRGDRPRALCCRSSLRYFSL